MGAALEKYRAELSLSEEIQAMRLDHRNGLRRAEPWHRGPMLGFDLETTGVDPDHDRIVGAALVDVQHPDPADDETQEWIVNPGVPIGAEATAVHGITDAQVAELGSDPVLVVPILRDALYGAWGAGYPVVIYNASFDLTVLDRELRRNGHAPLEMRGLVIDPFVLDRIAEPYRKGSRKLVDVARYWGADDVPAAEAHGARRDTMAALRTAWKIANRWPVVAYARPDRLMKCQQIARRVYTLGLRDWFLSKGYLAEAETCRPDWPIWADTPDPAAVGADVDCPECGAPMIEHTYPKPGDCPAAALMVPK